MRNLQEWINEKFRDINDHLHTYGLEYFAVDHCSLKCLGCSQISPYMDEHFSDPAVFEKSLKILKKYLRPQKLTILGGEPLLHPNIDLVIMIAKRSKMFEEVHITTNGTNITKMSDKFWKNIDNLIISKYPTNSAYIDSIFDEVRENCEHYNVRLEIRDMKSFNYIVLSKENKDNELVGEIFDRCIYKFYCHTLSDNRIFRCSPVVNFGKRNSRNKFAQYDNVDYLKIEDSDHFQSDLYEYLSSAKPLVGCQFCLGTSGKSFPHRQLSKKELENPEEISVTAENDYNLKQK